MKKFTKKEIYELIIKGDGEGLGFKEPYYMGALVKIMFNNMEKTK